MTKFILILFICLFLFFISGNCSKNNSKLSQESAVAGGLLNIITIFNPTPIFSNLSNTVILNFYSNLEANAKTLKAATDGYSQNCSGTTSVQNLQTLWKANIASLKEYAIEKLKVNFPDCKINGENTFYNLLNVLLPFDESKTAMILFHLDMKGIAVSRGSACQSGSIRPSHVLAEMLSVDDLKKPSLRISFSHFNTTEDIDLLIEALKTC